MPANIMVLQYPQLIVAVGLHSGAAFGVAKSPLGAIAVMQRGARNADGGAIRNAIGKFENLPRMPAIAACASMPATGLMPAC